MRGPRDRARRRVLASFAAGAAATLGAARFPGNRAFAQADHAGHGAHAGHGDVGNASTAPTPPGAQPAAAGKATDVCANGSTFVNRLALPGAEGFLGFHAIEGPFTLAATPSRSEGLPPLVYAVERGGRRWQNPVLTAERGTRARIAFANGLDQPTIVHWHGLAVDGRNDGNGSVVAQPGGRFDYAFDIADRASMYWYHPHPHGMTAGQAHRGLAAPLLVDDGEDRALRRALAVERGSTELVLMLADTRQSNPHGYTPSDDDRLAGYLGDQMRVNGTTQPFHEVATRGYRLRILNAANARSFRLAFRGDDGALLPFVLLGTDGGLLARPVECREAFVASAERVDLWIDFAKRSVGDSVVMESLAFDPMHNEGHGGHGGPATAAAAPSADLHAGHGGGAAVAPAADAPSSIGDGARLSLLQFRVRDKVAPSPPPPARLSSLADAVAPEGDAFALRLSFAKSRWRINDRVFAMDAEPIAVARNSKATWLWRNYYTSMPHPMHLHGFPMRVVAREQSPDFLAPLAIDAKGRLPTDLGVKDTVLVWPGESVRVAIDFRCAFEGPQDYLVHCHNLEHEDGGMMLPMRVA